MKIIIDFLKDEEGQNTIEYILLAAVMVFILYTFGKKAQTELGAITTSIFQKANDLITNLNTIP